MKKPLFFLQIFFATIFFATNLTCCAEDFFIDTTFTEAKNKVEIPPPQQNNEKNQEEVIKTKKKGFFSKETKKVKFNYLTNEEEEIPQGYYGELPDIEADFKYKKQYSPTSNEIDVKVVEENELIEDNFKPAPFNDPLFLDMVVKKQPDSQYFKDIQRTKRALMELKKCIEENGDIQRFNANVNTVELYVQNLKRKYENKSESLKESYIDVLNTNYYAKLLGNLKYDANYYAQFVPIADSKYNKSSILYEEKRLLNKINKTLMLLNNET